MNFFSTDILDILKSVSILKLNLKILAKRRASPGYARDHGFGSSGIFWGNLFCLDFTDDSLFTKIFLCIV